MTCPIPRSLWGICLAAFGCGVLPGCTTPNLNRAEVSAVAVSGTLSDDEAARLALLNNAAFLELMADLGIAKAELIQANELPNPTMTALFPMGPKQLEFYAKFPAEALWLRPKRTAIAKLNEETIAKRLMQDGADLVRDVKIACADLRLANRKVKLASEEAVLLKRFADLAEARLEAGDTSELEVSTAAADVIQAQIKRDRTPMEASVAFEDLRHLMGASNGTAEFSLEDSPRLLKLDKKDDSLIEMALATRPDLRAAEIQIESEGKRIGLAQAEVFKITGIFDSNGDGTNFEAGPGLDLTLPIFNQNQGAKALGDARFQKACQRYVTVRDQIAKEVRQSLARFRQAERDLKSIQNELLPALNRNIQQTERAWEGGEIAYLFVLDSNRKLQAARLAEVETIAECQRAAAELERSIGTTSSVLAGN